MNIVKRNPQHAVGTVLPLALRLMDIATKGSPTQWRTQATVLRGAKTIDLTWTHAQANADLQPGQLVQPLTLPETYAIVPACDVLSNASLMATIPQTWGVNADHLERLTQLWSQWPKMLRGWFNALFWYEPERLKGFLTAPASLRHHHAYPGGLLEHSLDCVDRVLAQAQGDTTVNQHVLSFVTLLHDVGKAQEYGPGADGYGAKMSLRGELMGHKLSNLEWLAAARVQSRIAIPDSLAMLVYHAMTATHAPDYVGLRSPRTPEAFYLSSVDQISGMASLFAAHANPQGGFGRSIPFLRGRPYTLDHSVLSQLGSLD